MLSLRSRARFPRICTRLKVGRGGGKDASVVLTHPSKGLSALNARLIALPFARTAYVSWVNTGYPENIRSESTSPQ